MTSPKLRPEELTVLAGEDNLQMYLFGEKVVEHQFCKKCGVYVFYTGKQCKVNLGCIEGIDIFNIPIELYDGANLL